MPSEANALRQQLRAAGVAPGAIRAVWPEWWSNEAELSRSAVAQLKYTVARRLGLSPRSLFDGPPRFVWKDEAKFKNLGAQSDQELAILTSFGVAVGRCAVDGTGQGAPLPRGVTAEMLRDVVLASSPIIGLRELLGLCWSFGIPVIQLALFPLARKRMHAITVQVRGRYAILVGRASKFPAPVAYIVAHELGHIVLRHVVDSAALVEAEDPLTTRNPDNEEAAADRFALELLTGDPAPVVQSNEPRFTAGQLAEAARIASADYRIDPGVLALCLGHSTGHWRQAFGALKILPPGEVDVGAGVNALAKSQLDWASLSLENRDFLITVMGELGES